MSRNRPPKPMRDALARLEAMQAELDANPIVVPAWVTDPIDREMLRHGYAREELAHDDPFDQASPIRRSICDNPGAEVKRRALEREATRKAQGLREATRRRPEAVDYAWEHYDAQKGRKSKKIAAAAAHSKFPEVAEATIRKAIQGKR